eukprot:g11514.t1
MLPQEIPSQPGQIWQSSVVHFDLSFAGLACPGDWLGSEGFLPKGAATEHCHLSWRLGAAPARVAGPTARCTDGQTVDVRTKQNGRMKGAVLNTKNLYVASFWSVPYAAGAGRWSHARPLEAFPDPQAPAADHCSEKFLQQLRPEAAQHGSHCFQWLPALGRFGVESCLTLDVYTPAVVKVPGGGFLVGDKYQQGIYDGRKLVDKQDVVLVSINYRLGVLGFLHHPYLRDEENHLMNFGLRDQLVALRWVHESLGCHGDRAMVFSHFMRKNGSNIAAFGGDPKRVTLVGESAGAMSICAHLASPAARPFFSNVIMESTNCDGFFIWQPQKFAQDQLGKGRLGHALHPGRLRTDPGMPRFDPAEPEAEESQNDCSSTDTAPIRTVYERCSEFFFSTPDEHNFTAFVEMLPLEWIGGCDGRYRGCEELPPLPSRLPLDDALLRCARRLDAGHVWVNQFGITHRHKSLGSVRDGRVDVETYLGWTSMDFTGMPLPPHLPWAPVVDPTGPVSLHYGTGGGLLTLPHRALSEEMGGEVVEGTLFSLLVPHFLGYVPRFSSTGMVDEDHNTMRLQRILTDYLFVCPTLRFLKTMERRSSNSSFRIYEFEADDELPSLMPDLKNTLGAFHVSELFFVFGNEEGPGGNLPMQGGAFGLGLGFTKQDVVISKKMADSWGALVRHEEVPHWPNLTTNQVLRFVLDVPGNVDYISLDVVRKIHHCKFFDQLHLKMSDAYPEGGPVRRSATVGIRMATYWWPLLVWCCAFTLSLARGTLLGLCFLVLLLGVTFSNSSSLPTRRRWVWRTRLFALLFLLIGLAFQSPLLPCSRAACQDGIHQIYVTQDECVKMEAFDLSLVGSEAQSAHCGAPDHGASLGHDTSWTLFVQILGVRRVSGAPGPQKGREKGAGHAGGSGSGGAPSGVSACFPGHHRTARWAGVYSHVIRSHLLVTSIEVSCAGVWGGQLCGALLRGAKYCMRR